ncbi:MAG: preprotein translocase subunit SecY, partial [Nitrososphaerales archaeon]
SMTERLIWTGIALGVFLVMTQIPLFGTGRVGQDPLAYSRVIFASAQGTLMELGIGPIVTAGLIMQLLKGSEIIKFDFTKPEEKALFTSSTKFLTIIVAFAEAAAFIGAGFYGPNIQNTVAMVILLQLFGSTVVVMLLDEMIQKGWGIGSGISLFILAGVTKEVLWALFSPLSPDGNFFGVVPYAVNATLSGNFLDSVTRAAPFPNLITLALTAMVIGVIIYVEGMKIEIPITSTRFKGFSGSYPIKLLYPSVIPVILASALIANITFMTQFLSARVRQFPFLEIFGRFDPSEPGVPIGGMIYYISSPGRYDVAAADPIRVITFVAFLTLACIFFSKIWVSVGGLSPEAAAKSLLDAKVQVPGFRSAGLSVQAILKKYIPAVTILGGLIIGLLASLSDILGIFGTGTGVLLMVSITLQYYQTLMREHIETVMPKLGAILGRS